MVVGGDFNCILDIAERSGGSGALLNDSQKFEEWVEASHLIDMGFFVPSFTWSRGRLASNRVAKRLDRVFINAEGRIFPRCRLITIPSYCPFSRTES